MQRGCRGAWPPGACPQTCPMRGRAPCPGWARQHLSPAHRPRSTPSIRGEEGDSLAGSGEAHAPARASGGGAHLHTGLDAVSAFPHQRNLGSHRTFLGTANTPPHAQWGFSATPQLSVSEKSREGTRRGLRAPSRVGAAGAGGRDLKPRLSCRSSPSPTRLGPMPGRRQAPVCLAGPAAAHGLVLSLRPTPRRPPTSP